MFEIIAGGHFMLWRSSNARIYAVHLTTANQSEIRRAYTVPVYTGWKKIEFMY